MKRYFGTTATSLASITSAVRTSTGININGTEDISLWTRSDTGNFPSKYSGVLTKSRRVELLPESTDSNTLITTDGLILVVEGTTVTVADLFEPEGGLYDDISPDDYQLILARVTNNEAPDKKILAGFGDGVNPLKFLNTFVYSESGTTHFYSQMDYPLATDEYGLYTVPDAQWASTYREVASVSVLKKPFLYVRGPLGMSVSFESGTNTEGVSLSAAYTGITNPDGSRERIFRLKFLYIDQDTDDRFMRLVLTTEQTNCTVSIY